MAQHHEPAATPTSRQRILVADRRPETCGYLTRLLSQRYDIRSARDASTASALIQEWAPALIVADAGLRSARDFNRLRALGPDEWGRVPIIWYSTTGADDPANTPPDAALEDDVVVPLSERHLLSLVAAQLGLIRMREDSTRALRLSEERFRILKTALTSGVWIADRTGGLIGDLAWWWEDLTGQTPKQSSGTGWMDVVHPEDSAYVAAARQVAVASGKPYQSEFRVKTCDGLYRHVRVQGAPVRDGNGRVREWVGTLFDIEDYRRAETALRLSEERYRTFVAMTTVALWTVTPGGDVVTDMSGWSELTGQTIEAVQRLGWLNAVHPDDRPGTSERWSYALRTGTQSGGDLRLRRKDGSYVYVHSYGIPVRDATGALCEWIGAIVDIDRQKQAEEALRTSEAELRANFELAGIGQVQTDPETGRYIRVNDRFCEMVGYTREELLNLTYLDITHPDDRADGRAVLTERLRDTSSRSTIDARDKRYIRKDGSILWGLVTSTLIRDADGRPLRTITMVEDVTNRRQAEALSHGQKHALEMVAQGASLDDVFDFVIQTVERQATVQLRGCIHVLDEHGAPRLMRAPSMPEDCRQALAACFENSPHVRRMLATSQGRSIVVADLSATPEWAEIAAALTPCAARSIWMTPVLSSSHQLLGSVCLFGAEPRTPSPTQVQLLESVAQTIALATERRQAETEREELLMLEQAAREVAEEANRLKDEFMAVVSHELRAPLNAINGWAEILLRGVKDALTQEQALQSIKCQVRSQAALINDLMDVARIASGKIRLESRDLDVSRVIHTSLDVARPAAAAKQIDLLVDLDPAVTTVSADAERLQQVLTNLLSNAIKFTPERGRVTVRSQRLEDGIEIAVVDTGQGISADFLPYVFDRFRQAEGATAQRHDGLGLGLAIVQQLVELHGGTVSAASDGEGKGATFTIRLPVSARAVGTLRPPAPEPAANLKGLRVLVVDDRREDREILSTELAHHGATVSASSSAAEGLVELHEFRPDVVVADISLPGEDGYRLIRRIRSSPLTHERHTPAIALTAHAGEANRKRALDAGYQEHLTKPADLNHLVRTIVRVAHRDAA